MEVCSYSVIFLFTVMPMLLYLILTESAPRPIQSKSCDVRGVLWICCLLLETTLPGGLETSVSGLCKPAYCA